jgi:predicted nucleic acid-binding protein
VIVLDASALVELLLHTPAGAEIDKRIADPSIGLHVPHLADIEVTQVFRRYVREGEIAAADAAAALQDLQDLDLQRHSHDPMLQRVWQLRENLTAYDAIYFALAEVLSSSLLTCDARLARAPGLRCPVEVIKPSVV